MGSWRDGEIEVECRSQQVYGVVDNKRRLILHSTCYRHAVCFVIAFLVLSGLPAGLINFLYRYCCGQSIVLYRFNNYLLHAVRSSGSQTWLLQPGTRLRKFGTRLLISQTWCQKKGTRLFQYKKPMAAKPLWAYCTMSLKLPSFIILLLYLNLIIGSI